MKSIKKLALSILVVLGLIIFVSCTNNNSKSKVGVRDNTKTIAILKYGTHTSLDEIEEGIIKKINSELIGYTIKKYDCNFDSAIISQTITAIKDLDLACVVGIATPVAVALANNFSDIPVVFAAVSDPFGAGIIGDNVTGTSDAMQLESLINLEKEVNKEAKNFGFIYTQTEANSNSNLIKLQDLSKTMNFNLQVKSINQTFEITENLNSLIDSGIDSLIVTDDNNVASGMDIISDICSKKNIGVYCAADSEVKDGGMIGYSISYSKLAEYTATQVLEIVKDKKAVSDVKIKYFDEASDLKLYYNSNFLAKSSKYNSLITDTIKKKGIDLASK